MKNDDYIIDDRLHDKIFEMIKNMTDAEFEEFLEQADE